MPQLTTGTRLPRDRLRGSIVRMATSTLVAQLVLLLGCWGLLSGRVGADAIPPFTRGPEPTFMVPLRNRENGVTFLGSHERLRVAMDKLMRGVPTVVAVAGGSNTVGHGAYDGMPWPRYLMHWLQDTFPSANVTVQNGAIAGTTSAYMSVCCKMHIPDDASIVVLEYSHNDAHHSHPPIDNAERRPFERLVRKVLAYPSRPAVLLLHTWVWWETTPFKGNFWDNAERDLAEFAWYYELPSVSVKACCYHLMRSGVTGFRVDHARRDVEGLKGLTFYSDGVHGAGDTGYRAMAELVIHLMRTAMAGLKAVPLNSNDTEAAARALAPPMVPGNWPSASDRCLIGSSLLKAVHGPLDPAWSWIDESHRPDRQPKLGFVSGTVGSTIRFKIDTTIGTEGVVADAVASPPPPSPAPAPGGVEQAPAAPPIVSVGIAHLRSYEHMGQASVSCSNGCECSQDLVLHGMQQRRVSQLHIHSIAVTQAPECILSIAVLANTTSGEHKVKVQGIFISEESGSSVGMVSTGVLDSMQGFSAQTASVVV